MFPLSGKTVHPNNVVTTWTYHRERLQQTARESKVTLAEKGEEEDGHGKRKCLIWKLERMCFAEMAHERTHSIIYSHNKYSLSTYYVWTLELSGDAWLP